MSEPKTRRELGLLATGGLVASALAVGYAKPAAAHQGNMDHARAALADALRFLEQAEPNKGGFRESAIQSVKAAISQVDEGIRWAATH